MKLKRILFIAFTCLASTGTMGAETVSRLLTEKIDTYCQQPTPQQLSCDYRMIQGEMPQSVTAHLQPHNLPMMTEAQTYPFPQAQTAILFVVDVSNPRRQKVVKKNIKQIRAMLGKAQAHQRFGLIALGTDFYQLVALGATAEELSPQVEQLNARDVTTELYRHTLAAVEELAAFEATRKALFLFSDGKAEDATDAYSREDVVNAALNAKVMIYGLGYPFPKETTPDLQRLIRLAEDTGGIYRKASKTSVLPETFLSAPFRFIDNGARLQFDLNPAISAGLSGEQQVLLKFQRGEDSDLELAVKIILPEPEPMPEMAEAPPEPDFLQNNWLYLVGVGLLLLLLAAYILRRAGQTQQASASKTYAHLHSLDGNERFVMNKTTVRIGRNADNEICLRNDSVSSHHAEIHLGRQQQFVLVDLDSTNGVMLNGEFVKGSIELEAEDLLEIGEVRLRFAPVET
ncbi:FHA domain-containing protein [Candidatus Venteria ishoeyi]|uniref:Transcriptional regulatory protein EmbR n=1 Tax=Candidatus Venteria ishoeyi TaxID=1899563 RepID=A0A1H6FF01_9GAMM|nr:FHA domain-containing protein [Candidatus Venteria ishoeyi]SEH08658.1 Transcriptional regulatory protein EmbR [Candidatus Venteria ishoeyi]